ncbi:MAG: hypothetical protein HBSAPP03_00870 [Phycisphaerae bacterium]|nr:MAG: hypothetical protein HBSAPP03_00870 [Phycisphaerae bacterium]
MRAEPDHIRELFRRHDLRCTHQREIVYAELSATNSHPTAEELYQTLHVQDPNISLATVYNTLDAFLGVGLARRIPSSGACRYDAITEPHVHVTTPDGRVVDAPEDLSDRLLAGISPDIIRELEARMGVTVSGLTVQVVTNPATS